MVVVDMGVSGRGVFEAISPSELDVERLIADGTIESLQRFPNGSPAVGEQPDSVPDLRPRLDSVGTSDAPAGFHLGQAGAQSLAVREHESCIEPVRSEYAGSLAVVVPSTVPS